MFKNSGSAIKVRESTKEILRHILAD